jgi:hypothetical protein
MGDHLIDGESQSDKYPTCPRGKVPLSVKDKTAQDLLWAYAQRRRVVDAEFSADLEEALRVAGYVPMTTPTKPPVGEMRCRNCGAVVDAHEEHLNIACIANLRARAEVAEDSAHKYYVKARVYGAIAAEFRSALQALKDHPRAAEALAWRYSEKNGVPMSAVVAIGELLDAAEECERLRRDEDQHQGFVTFANAEIATLRTRAESAERERDAIADCKQDGDVCATKAPGCIRHFLQLNAELVRARDEARAEAEVAGERRDDAERRNRAAFELVDVAHRFEHRELFASLRAALKGETLDAKPEVVK